MTYEDITSLKEFKELIGILRKEIIELKEKLKECADSAKKIVGRLKTVFRV